MIKKRKGLQLIDALIEEKLLTEETECLLRAQFSGMFPNDLCNTYWQLLIFMKYHYIFILYCLWKYAFSQRVSSINKKNEK